MAVGCVKLLVVGDSLTHGIEGDYTWRYRLYEHLSAQGVGARFVGPFQGTHRTQPFAEAVPVISYDGAYRAELQPSAAAHSASWGWMLRDGSAVIAEHIQRYAPDYLLVALGFNDVAWCLGDATPDEIARAAIANLKELVACARGIDPGVRILVADLPERAPLADYPGLPHKLATYNAALAVVAPMLNVVHVPVAASYRFQRDTYDGLHPNVHGEYVIAKAYADLLATRFGLGAPMRIPSERPRDLEPQAVSSVRAHVHADGLELSWPHVFGAAGFWLWMRDHARGEREFRRLLWPVPAYGWRGFALEGGQRVDFKVQTMRGDYVSACSPVVSVWQAAGA